MNPYVIGPSGFSTREEIRGPFHVSERPVVCPKPRRLGFNCSEQPVRSLRWHMSHQADPYDSRLSPDVLDIILKGGDGGCVAEQYINSQVVASSPPFFSGSPPSRVANPLIQDARFRDEKFSPPPDLSPPCDRCFSPSSSPNSSARKTVGYARANFGNNPAVRVEGFDCLDRDRRHCGIPTLA